MFRLKPHDFRFPPVDRASPDGLLAVGGDLRPERLLEAYRQGIFPWYNDDQPILWWSPDPRAVLFPDKLHVSRSLKRSLRPHVFTVALDQCFHEVIWTPTLVCMSAEETGSGPLSLPLYHSSSVYTKLGCARMYFTLTWRHPKVPPHSNVNVRFSKWEARLWVES